MNKSNFVCLTCSNFCIEVFERTTNEPIYTSCPPVLTKHCIDSKPSRASVGKCIQPQRSVRVYVRVFSPVSASAASYRLLPASCYQRSSRGQYSRCPCTCSAPAVFACIRTRLFAGQCQCDLVPVTAGFLLPEVVARTVFKVPMHLASATPPNRLTGLYC